MSERIPAIVLAGGKAKPEIVAATGVENRALIPVNGRTMLDHIVTALRDSNRIGDVIVVGNVPEDGRYRSIPDQGGFVENIFAGLAAAGSSDHALLATSDIPFVRGEAVEDFASRSAALQADMVYPIVPVEACYRRFPGVKRTSLALKEGRFTGGNMVLVRTGFMEAQRARIAAAYAARKSPLRLALMLGLGTTTRLLGTLALKRPLLSIPALESAVSRLIGGRGRALISEHPEIATDIDRPEDLEAIGITSGGTER